MKAALFCSAIMIFSNLSFAQQKPRANPSNTPASMRDEAERELWATDTDKVKPKVQKKSTDKKSVKSDQDSQEYAPSKKE
jgi:hypothetical protein